MKINFAQQTDESIRQLTVSVLFLDSDDNLICHDEKLLDREKKLLQEEGKGTSVYKTAQTEPQFWYVAGKKNDETAIRKAVAFFYKTAKKHFYENAVLDFSQSDSGIKDCRIAEIVCDAIFTLDYKYVLFKQDKSVQLKNAVIKLNDFSDKDAESIIDKNSVIAKGINLVRDMVNAPANIMTIDTFEETAVNVCAECGLTVTVLDKKILTEKGMNLLLAVGQAGIQPPKMLKIVYQGNPGGKMSFVVGKGIVFDSGGMNLKPGNSLNDMKMDMAGAATALGIVTTAANLKLNCNITALLPLAENAIGSKSMHTGDVIVGYKKKSVEINNTDAEGRLILADALAYADEQKPELIIDIATLTGAALIALGSKITAGFFTDETVKNKMLAAAKETGEGLWELPLVDDYREYLKSKIADISNISTPPREAGTITAALFLQSFVENAEWVHLDIAGPAFIDSDWNEYPAGATGAMLKTVIRYFETR
ncbi:MAG: leucyl aminopeptidase family protein [Spirochaetales bacterium]|nr:leucyl aminopeptidase family protein [Spirochaetales bacterium]